MRLLRFAVLFGIFATSFAHSREWTSVDGRTIDAEFVSADATSVSVKRSSDLRVVRIPFDKLSEADQKWVAENKDKTRPRLGLDPEPADLTDNAYADLLKGDWQLAEFRDLPYAVFGPKDVDPTKKYPVILGLHGKSSNDENGKQTNSFRFFTGDSAFKKNPAIVIAPLCYQPFGGTGGGWHKKPGDLAIDLVKDIKKKLPIVDPDRIYVLGYSMGGGGTAKLIADEPKLFAAGIIVAGWVDGSSEKAFRKVPVWAFHGSEDDVVKPDSIRAAAKLLKRSKIFKYTEFEGFGHSIVGQTFKDPEVIKWLFAQKK